jgi:predicted AlkP superfamily phosphohydrolase/phosphomutase
MSARHLVLGLDGADLEVVLALGRARLPSLFALMQRGLFAHQKSVEPPATLPNWTTFLTGLDPGAHGVFDFTMRRGYGVRFTAGTVREAPTWLARLDALGMACACVGFPATWPPERLRHGVFISGWDSPVATTADRSFVWPPALHAQLTRRFGPLRFDEVDQFNADRPGFHARLGRSLADKVARRSELGSYLLASRRWDMFAFYFGESDSAAHYLWSLYDEGSPRRPAQVDRDESEGLVRVYEALDRAVGRLVAAAGEDSEITLVSDHGSGGSSDRVLYLNRALAAAGLLHFRERERAAPWSALKAAALARLSPRVRERLFRAGGSVLSSWLESRVRFASIDMARSVAFSDELNYFPAVHLNLKGREPRGVVDPHERERVLGEVRAALSALRDPDTRRHVVRAVHRREDLFEGPFVERAPDLLLELELTRGYSYNLVPSAGPGPVFARLEPAQYLGKKGRSLPGSHRPRGLFIAAGPRVRARGQVELSIADAAAFVLARVGVEAPAGARGRIQAEWLSDAAPSRALPEVNRARVPRADTGTLERRLRALGYID